MGWFSNTPAPPPQPIRQSKPMRKMNAAEIWTDDHGVIGILNTDGTYTLYVNPEQVTFGGQPIADEPKVRARLNQALLSIINTKTRTK